MKIEHYKYLSILVFLISFNISSQAQNGLSKTYFDDGKLESEINYINFIREGEAKFYYLNGNVKEERNYSNGKIDGLVKVYNENGKLTETFNLEAGKREGPASYFDEEGNYLVDVPFIAGKLDIEINSIDERTDFTTQPDKTKETANVTPETKTVKKGRDDISAPPVIEEVLEDDPAYYLTVEVMPEPVGGIERIEKKIIYPDDARKNKIEGMVKIRAYIDETGEVTQADVVEGIGHGCDEAAKMSVFFTKFSPGLQKGKPVRVQMVVPIEFKLPEYEGED